MKKIIALFVALAICSSSVFALPASASLNNPVQTKTEISKPEVSIDFTPSAFAEDDPFADVQATPLTTEQAQAVEGEGWFGGIAGFTIGYIGGIMQYGVGSALSIFGIGY